MSIRATTETCADGAEVEVFNEVLTLTLALGRCVAIVIAVSNVNLASTNSLFRMRGLVTFSTSWSRSISSKVSVNSQVVAKSLSAAMYCSTVSSLVLVS